LAILQASRETRSRMALASQGHGAWLRVRRAYRLFWCVGWGMGSSVLCEERSLIRNCTRTLLKTNMVLIEFIHINSKTRKFWV